MESNTCVVLLLSNKENRVALTGMPDAHSHIAVDCFVVDVIELER